MVVTAMTEDFDCFVKGRSTALLRTAFLLVGDRGHAEDLLQDVLTKTARQWHRIDGPPEAYVRRALMNAAINGWRRRRLQETPLRAQHDNTAADLLSTIDLRDALLRGLRELAPQQRAVLVCRYFDDLSEADTAALLGCSVGTVKSNASRGLQRLRELAPHLLDRTTP